MEAHYGKLAILAIVLIFAVTSVSATYSLDRNLGQRSLRARLCPDGYVPLAYVHGGAGGAGGTLVHCYEGDVVPQVGRTFRTSSQIEQRSRFMKYDRFRSPEYNIRIRG